MTTLISGRPGAVAEAAAVGERNWRLAGIALLSVRVIQGFIYWGGGSRRFIYAPSKLDPNAPNWMANKFQSAMPGALLGTDHIIVYMLQHFWLLYAAVILFSAAELMAGAALMAGLLTRLSAAVSIGFSIVLMLMFGWQGATCIDEWTMAAYNLGMGATLMLAGCSAYSLDNVLLKRHPGLAGRSWFLWLGGSLPLPLTDAAFRNFGLAVLVAVLAYNVGTYNYFRGSVVTPYHSGPVSPTLDHFAISKGVVLPDGEMRFHIYLDGGAPEAPAHLMKAELIGNGGLAVETWNTDQLTRLPPGSIRNHFAYNKFTAGPYGLVATMGAAATTTLPRVAEARPPANEALLKLSDVNGRSFTTALAPAESDSRARN